MKNTLQSIASLCCLVLVFSACSSTGKMKSGVPAASMEEAASMVVASEPTDRVEDLVNKNLDARGGADLIKGIRTMKWDGEVAAMGMNMSIKMYMKRPAKLRSEVNISSMNMEMITGYDGKTAWMLNPMAGPEPQILPDEMARQTAEQANMDGILMDYKERGIAIEYVGEDTVEDRPAYKLKVVREDQPETFVFLDAETYLEVMTQAEIVNPQSGETILAQTYMRDFRDVGNGVVMPFHIETKMDGGMGQSITLSAVEINQEVDDELFMVPVPAVDVK